MPILANIIQEAFSPLISLFEAVLVFIHDHAGISWGLAIVGLTVIVRAVMMPATFSQLRSMRKMQLVAPELKALKEKYKDDKQRQQEEMMKLYREKGINPFASCLPLVLQLPVFISLFYMLRTDLKKHICGPSLVSSYNAMHHAAITTSLAPTPSGHSSARARTTRALATPAKGRRPSMNAHLRACDSTSRTSAAGRATARANPGKPAPEPRSAIFFTPVIASTSSATSESAMCTSIARTGSRTVVGDRSSLATASRIASS